MKVTVKKRVVKTEKEIAKEARLEKRRAKVAYRENRKEAREQGRLMKKRVKVAVKAEKKEGRRVKRLGRIMKKEAGTALGNRKAIAEALAETLYKKAGGKDEVPYSSHGLKTRATRKEAEIFARFVAAARSKGCTVADMISGQKEYEGTSRVRKWYAVCPPVCSKSLTSLLDVAEEHGHAFIVQNEYDEERGWRMRYFYDFEKGKLRMGEVKMKKRRAEMAVAEEELKSTPDTDTQEEEVMAIKIKSKANGNGKVKVAEKKERVIITAKKGTKAGKVILSKKQAKEAKREEREAKKAAKVAAKEERKAEREAAREEKRAAKAAASAEKESFARHECPEFDDIKSVSTAVLVKAIVDDFEFRYEYYSNKRISMIKTNAERIVKVVKELGRRAK